MLSRLVNSANTVLLSQYFDNFKYKLAVHDIQILEDEDCTLQGKSLCEEGASLESLLDLYTSMARDDHYCLSYMLTYRDFPGGTLGLAWTATSAEGGVCDQRLNTGVISLSRNSLRVSERVAALTLSHEVGHSFGSPHDSGSCDEDDGGGHYLMHPSGSLGLRPNNMKMSRCSSANISSVLSGPRACWREERTSGVCGNGVVEGWEECDCGSLAECRDSCCVPPGDPLGRPACTLSQGSQCSPSEGLCCDSSCQYVSSNVTCSLATDCHREAKCTGRNPICPIPASLPDGTPCEEASRACAGGQCEASICSAHGSLPCSHDLLSDPRSSCSPHCRAPGAECQPLPLSFIPDTECSLAGGYGHCSQSGHCQVRDTQPGPGWLVGVIIFLVCYLLVSLLATYIYCTYCRGR